MMSGVNVKLSSLKIFALKLALFSSMLLYLGVDLFLWHGPVWRAMYQRHENESEREPALARVYGETITAGQLARYEAEQNWLRGQDEAREGQKIVRLMEPTPRRARKRQTREGQKIVRLMELVRGEILRIRARYNDKNLPDFAAAAQEEVERLASRAKTPEEFDAWLEGMGMTRKGFTQKLEAIMKATAQLERATAPHCEVTDEDVAKHYEQVKEQLIAPASRALKHIFLATLEKDPEMVKQQAQALMTQLEAGADFATLARTHSEDDHTAAAGGDLGVVQDDEHLALRELPLFGEQAAPAGQYTLAQSRWGWHILLPGEICPARQITLEEARESLRSAIRSAQYELAVKTYFDEAIREGFRKKHLQIHAK